MSTQHTPRPRSERPPTISASHQAAGQAIHSRKCGLYLGGGSTYARKAWILSWDMLGLGPVMKLQKKTPKISGYPVGTQQEEPIIFNILPYKHTI